MISRDSGKHTDNPGLPAGDFPGGLHASVDEILFFPVLVVEVGSTITKANAFDRVGRHLAHGFGLTSVDRGDVGHGILEAICNLAPVDETGADQGIVGSEPGDSLGPLSEIQPLQSLPLRALPGCPVTFERLYVNSSAAGGLKMTVHGLTMEMTARAAREASLGAGAIVKLITAGRIKPRDCEKLAVVAPNIVILAGGTDHGDEETVVENARVLAAVLGNPRPEAESSPGTDVNDPHAGVCHTMVPVLYAGNAAAWDEVRDIFKSAGVEAVRCENVYPALDELNVEPAREVIMELFARHIVRAPGMKFLSRAADGSVFPTPAAVMEAARLFRELYGDVTVIDVGGATTDVHSVTTGSDAYRNRMINPEPLAKRTVEGDLGVFVNAVTLNEAAVIRGNGSRFSADCVDLSVLKPIPSEPDGVEVARRLAAKAVLLGVKRHAGSVRTLFMAEGKRAVVKGRDLTAVRYLVGTGGALTRLPGGEDALRSVCTGDSDENLMPPADCRVALDRRYLFSALGTLALNDPDLAMKAAKRYFRAILE